MSVDHDELTLLKDTLRSREEELRDCKRDAAEKGDAVKSLRQELEKTRTSLEEKLERLSTFVSLAGSINSTLDLNQLLTYLMTCATKIMKAKDSSLMLLDERANELVFKVALGEKGDQMQEFRLKMGQGIAGQVALSGEPIVVSDTAADKRFELHARNAFLFAQAFLYGYGRLPHRVHKQCYTLDPSNTLTIPCPP